MDAAKTAGEGAVERDSEEQGERGEKANADGATGQKRKREPLPRSAGNLLSSAAKPASNDRPKSSKKKKNV